MAWLFLLRTIKAWASFWKSQYSKNLERLAGKNLESNAATSAKSSLRIGKQWLVNVPLAMPAYRVLLWAKTKPSCLYFCCIDKTPSRPKVRLPNMRSTNWASAKPTPLPLKISTMIAAKAKLSEYFTTKLFRQFRR